MKRSKRFFKHPAFLYVLSWLLAWYIRLVYFTSRKEYHIDPDTEPYLRGEYNAIFAFWHGRMMLLPAFCPPGHTMRVLISHHRDGKLISDVISHFGQSTINGSTSRGGKEAVRDILRSLKAGDNISITPDGPRGPARVAAQGTATVARLARKPVLPITFSSSRHIRFNSWDQFMLALPFGRIIFCAGTPILIDDTDENKARLRIEYLMKELDEKADRLANA